MIKTEAKKTRLIKNCIVSNYFYELVIHLSYILNTVNLVVVTVTFSVQKCWEKRMLGYPCPMTCMTVYYLSPKRKLFNYDKLQILIEWVFLHLFTIEFKIK